MKFGVKKNFAQAALEYLLLLGAVVIVVLLAFNTLLSQQQQKTEGYFNVVARGVYGAPAVYWNESGNRIDRLRVTAQYP